MSNTCSRLNSQCVLTVSSQELGKIARRFTGFLLNHASVDGLKIHESANFFGGLGRKSDCLSENYPWFREDIEGEAARANGHIKYTHHGTH